MRLIDADQLKLKESLEEAKQCREEAEAKGDTEIAIRASGAYFAFLELLLRVKAFPKIDAVQVVRCKECKHWKKDIFQTGDNFVGICRRKAAIKSEFPCTADGFCKWAERRKE